MDLPLVSEFRLAEPFYVYLPFPSGAANASVPRRCGTEVVIAQKLSKPSKSWSTVFTNGVVRRVKHTRTKNTGFTQANRPFLLLLQDCEEGLRVERDMQGVGRCAAANRWNQGLPVQHFWLVG